MQGLLTAADLALHERRLPTCGVCGRPLGEYVTLDVLSTLDGGEFRLSCDAADPAHEEGVRYWYDVRPGAAAAVALRHVGNKGWADPAKVFSALWPWLRNAVHRAR